MNDPIKLIGFPNTGLLVFHAGIEKGFFEKHGAPVELEVTPSSIYQLVNLIDGKFDIACGAVDNFIAYQEKAGEEIPKKEPDLCVFMGATQIELSFVVAKEIQSFEDIRGTKLAMDALTTGFAFVLYRMLDDAGLSSDDYEMVSVGATPHRWAGVQSGEFSGTLLIEPFTGQARASGFKILASSRETFKNYPGQMFGAMRGWVRSCAQGGYDAVRTRRASECPHPRLLDQAPQATQSLGRVTADWSCRMFPRDRAVLGALPSQTPSVPRPR